MKKETIKILSGFVVSLFTFSITVVAKGEEYNTYSEDYVYITTNLEQLTLMGVEPVNETLNKLPDRIVVVRTFKLPFDYPDIIPTDNFVIDGITFTLDSIEKVDTDQTQRKYHHTQVEIETSTSDINEILSKLEHTILFDNGEYVGELHLQRNTIQTNPRPSVSERRTVTDTRTYNNIAFGDIAGIARSFNRNGVVMSLVDINWKPNTSGVNSSMVSTTYNAIAHYEGTYYRNVIPGFITTATYSGEIVNFDLDTEIIYEVSFVSDRDSTIKVDYIEEVVGNEYKGNNLQERDNTEIYKLRRTGILLGITILVILLPLIISFILYKKGILNFDFMPNFFSRNKDEDVYYDNEDIEDEEEE